jgi:hypothetical protein
VVDAEALQRGLAGFADVLGVAADTEALAVRPADVAELGGDDHLVPVRSQRLADQALVGEGAVHVGGVEEGDPELHGAADHRLRLLLVGHPVELRHPHAAETKRGDVEVGAEGAGGKHAASLPGGPILKPTA